MNESIEVLENRESGKRNWTQNPLLALCEFGAVALIFFTSARLYISYPSLGAHCGCAVCGGLMLVCYGFRIGERQFCGDSFAVLP